jgi:choline-glycine betaine transporter
MALVHLVGGAITILKNMSSSMGKIIRYIVEKMFQTTNQLD